jgi:hypothetical protein
VCGKSLGKCDSWPRDSRGCPLLFEQNFCTPDQVNVKIHFAIINKNMTSVPKSANFMYKPASQQEVGTQNPISNLISGKRYLIKPCQSTAIHAEEITRRSHSKAERRGNKGEVVQNTVSV